MMQYVEHTLTLLVNDNLHVNTVEGLSNVFCLFFFSTSSQTALLHKHFAIAIVCSQLCFMFGITQYKHKLVCHAFAIALHYFFLASFSWLMNEAFNLYIVITYAAHSHGESESNSQWRYYILGWGK